MILAFLERPEASGRGLCDICVRVTHSRVKKDLGIPGWDGKIYRLQAKWKKISYRYMFVLPELLIFNT